MVSLGTGPGMAVRGRGGMVVYGFIPSNPPLSPGTLAQSLGPPRIPLWIFFPCPMIIQGGQGLIPRWLSYGLLWGPSLWISVFPLPGREGTGIYRWYPGACTYSMGGAGVSMGPTPIPPSPLYP